MIITIANVRLTPFAAGDTRALWEIRNHPTVLPWMSNPEPIAYAAHERWVQEHLLDERRQLLWMARHRDELFGFTLLRPAGEGVREIGAMFRDPERHPLAVFHAGFGTLYYAISVMGTALTTYFVPGHTRARHFDTAFGAWEIESDRPGQSRLFMTPEVCLASERYQRFLRRLAGRISVTE